MKYEDKLIELALIDPDIMILTAENRASIRNIPDRIPDRFIDTGIAEQTLIGVAAGLALRGRKPIVHALASFLTLRAFEFIRTDIGIPGLPVKLVGAVPGFLSEANGPTHQAIDDIGLMRLIPSMKIFCPADENELIEGISFLMNDLAPCYIRYNAQPGITKHSPFDGKAEIILSISDITILTYGFLLKEAITASEILSEEGFAAGVVNLRMLKPADTEMILRAASESSLLVILEDHLSTGGLFTIICEIIASKKISKDILSINLTNWFRPALLKDVLAYEEFTAEQIAGKIKSYYEMYVGLRVENGK